MNINIDAAVDFAEYRQRDGRYVVAFRLGDEEYVHGPFYSEMRALAYLEATRQQFLEEMSDEPPESALRDTAFRIIPLEAPCLLAQ